MREIPLPYKQTLLKEWLKAGAIDKGVYQDTESGTPQGGVISPSLANYTLAGLEEWVLNKPYNKVLAFRKNGGERVSLASKVNVVRYADDFIVTSRTQGQSGPIIKACDEFLGERGLELSKEKTKVTNVEKGFDFLGFLVRR